MKSPRETLVQSLQKKNNTMNTGNNQGNQHGSPGSSDRGVGKASLVRASHSPTGRTLSRTVSHGEGARATPFAPANPPSIISSALGPPGSDEISDIKRQSSGIPGSGDAILLKPRRSSASLENLDAERPFEKTSPCPTCQSTLAYQLQS